MTVEEINVCIEKMQKAKELIQNRSNGISAEDFVRRVKNTLGNCIKKVEVIEKMASKK